MNAHELHDQFRQLRKLGLQAADLEQRLQRALRRDRTGTTTPDGYPISTGGAGCGSSESTSVESAVLSRLGPGARDQHRALTLAALAALVDLVTAGQTLQFRLASIDDLGNDTGPAPKRCESCGGKRGQGNDRNDIHRGTCGDRLTHTMDLCRACRGFVEQTAPAGSREGRLPEGADIRHHEETGRWRIRLSTRTVAS